MIRINLLATERAPAAAPTAPGALQAYLLLGVGIAAAVLVCGVGWWTMTTDIENKKAEIAAKEQEKTQLQAIAKQVEELQRKERTIQEQVQLIQDLQRQRDMAMDVMRVVSESLPDFVWLTEMSQTGNRITFRGQSSTLTAVADFMAALQNAGEHCDQPEPAPNAPEPVKQYVAQRGGCYFPQVDLVNSQERNNVVSFDLAATYQPPRTPPAVPAAQPGQKAAPAAKAAQS